MGRSVQKCRLDEVRTFSTRKNTSAARYPPTWSSFRESQLFKMPLLGENETAIKRLSVFSKQALLLLLLDSDEFSTYLTRDGLLRLTPFFLLA
jgi:hypothetical protein